MGKSETINFRIAREPEPQPESFPISHIAVSIGIVAVVGASLLVYLKKRRASGVGVVKNP